jgi:hypothetical protein
MMRAHFRPPGSTPVSNSFDHLVGAAEHGRPGATHFYLTWQHPHLPAAIAEGLSR